jgi:putative MATE family efflux protein
VTDALTERSSRLSLRRIGSLAAPALVVLAAEPLYVLVDTAVVGHLGRVPLAAVAIGGTVLSLATLLGNFLAYGTTGRSARHFGAGDRAAAVDEGVQASWLALGFGLAFALVAQVAAGPVARLLTGGGPDSFDVAAGAETWLRIASLGAPGILLTLAGNGWLRGVQDGVRPMRYVVVANLLSVVLCPLLVYPAGLGLAGSAVANVVAQLVSAGLFARALAAERVPLRPRPAVLSAQLRVGRDLVIRTIGFQACFISAAAVAARFGPAVLGAHQIALQLWFFFALLLDALAIAAQSLVGADLGAGRIRAARATAWRVAGLGGVAGLLLGGGIGAGVYGLPRLFTDDGEVLRQAALAWPWFAGMMPLAGVVFALDGVLIGAGDVRFLRNLTLVGTLGVFLPAIWLAYWLDLGLGGIWAGLTVFIVVRLAAMLVRTTRGRWAVAGAVS